MKFSIGRFYLCRNGAIAKIYFNRAGSRYPIHGATFHEEKMGLSKPRQWVDVIAITGDHIAGDHNLSWNIRDWTKKGCYYISHEHPLDLVKRMNSRTLAGCREEICREENKHSST